MNEPEEKYKVLGIDVDEKLLNELNALKKQVPHYSKGGFRREVLKLGIEQFKIRIKTNGPATKKPIK